jgi:hypothetical protein
MKHNKKRVVIAAVTVCLLAAAGLSKPGRMAFNEVFFLIKGLASGKTTDPVSVLPAGQDTEQRARARHGWSNGVVNSVVRGTITYYKNDLVARQARVTLYYKFPDRMRVEEEYEGLVQAWGFGTDGEWRLRAGSLSEEERRDIRGWLRVWPVRLFVQRGAGGGYREVGSRVEGSRRAAPGRGSGELAEQGLLDEVEIIDAIGQGIGGGSPDQRAIYYLIDRENSIIKSARWIEPDDPGDSVDDPDAQTKEVRVDYSGWRRFQGILLPTQLTRWVAGRGDFSVDVSEVLVNQQMPDTLFQNPNR